MSDWIIPGLSARTEHRKVIADLMAEEFGSPFTACHLIAGYIYPDGSMLRMGLESLRDRDHSVVMWLYDDCNYAEMQSPKSTAQARFINEGNIRFLPESGSFDIGTEAEPTPAQYDAIRAISRFYSRVYIDFTTPDVQTSQHLEFEGTSPERIVNEIKNFYK